jgi:hypothetical protein
MGQVIELGEVQGSRRGQELALPNRVPGTSAYRTWKWNLKHKYKLDPAGWYRIIAEQGGKCAVCRRDEEMLFNSNRHGVYARTSFVVDHDHATGEVRGILCNDCNRAIGLLGESSQVLEAAARYLRPVS